MCCECEFQRTRIFCATLQRHQFSFDSFCVFLHRRYILQVVLCLSLSACGCLLVELICCKDASLFTVMSLKLKRGALSLHVTIVIVSSLLYITLSVSYLPACCSLQLSARRFDFLRELVHFSVWKSQRTWISRIFHTGNVSF